MRVRFFSDWGPNDVPRVLVGVSPDDPDRGEAREAVHVATQADIDAYPAAYAEYEKTVEAAKSAAPADTEAASRAETAAPSGSGSRGSSGSGGSGSGGSGSSGSGSSSSGSGGSGSSGSGSSRSTSSGSAPAGGSGSAAD